MCSQNAGNVISEHLILKISRGACPQTPSSLGVTKYEPPQTKPKLYAYDEKRLLTQHEIIDWSFQWSFLVVLKRVNDKFNWSFLFLDCITIRLRSTGLMVAKIKDENFC